MVWQTEAARSSYTDLIGFRQFSRELITAFVDYQADSSEGIVLQNAAREIASQFLDVLVSNNLRLVGRLYDLVSEHPDFEIFHEPTLYCFRYVPNALAERQEEPEVQSQLDRLNQAIVDAVRRSGLALVTTTRIRDRVAMQMSICPDRTLETDVDATFEAIARWGRLLSRNNCGDNEESAEVEEMPCSSESCSLPTEVSVT